MTVSSYRLAWATRGADNRLAIVLAAATGSFAFGLVFAAASGQPSPRLAFWSAGVVTAALIALDFPGAGHPRWREFELTLPIEPRQRARASLLLSLGFWLLPLLLTASLATLGAFGAGARLPLDAAFGRLWVAGACVLAAAALRHTFGLGMSGAVAAVLRFAMAGAVAIGFLVPSPVVGALALIWAVPLLAIAHRQAAVVPELSVRLPANGASAARSGVGSTSVGSTSVGSTSVGSAVAHGIVAGSETGGVATSEPAAGERAASVLAGAALTASSGVALTASPGAALTASPGVALTASPGVALTPSPGAGSAPTTFQRLALRYCVGNLTAAALLCAMLLWTFGATSGWLGNATWQLLFVPMWAAQHAGWGARLLRLGHLPFSRARLFRFFAWPQQVAIGLGLVLSLVWAAPSEWCRVETRDGITTLRTPQRLWRLTSGEPPLVTSPEGESHQPRAHAIGLGRALVAYNPYEVPAGASRGFLVHQFGRVLEAEHGLALDTAQLEGRYLSTVNGWRRFSSDLYPELADPLAIQVRLAAGALLLVLVLLGMRVTIRPGRALTTREWRRSPASWLLAGSFMLVGLYQFARGSSRDAADPVAIVVHDVARQLASHLWLVLPVALAIAALAYRSLHRRFEQMEAPLPSQSMDRWFLQI